MHNVLHKSGRNGVFNIIFSSVIGKWTCGVYFKESRSYSNRFLSWKDVKVYEVKIQSILHFNNALWMLLNKFVRNELHKVTNEWKLRLYLYVQNRVNILNRYCNCIVLGLDLWGNLYHKYIWNKWHVYTIAHWCIDRDRHTDLKINYINFYTLF